MTRQYIFRLENFQIFNTMALHEDSDFVYFALKVRDQLFGPRHEKIGDLNNGTFQLGWEFGPVEVNDGDQVILTYQIMNHGHDDAQKQLADDVAIADKIAASVGAISATAFPPAAAVIGSIVAGLKEAGEALKWIFDFANCDGQVLNDAFPFRGAELAELTKAGVFTQTKRYEGPDTPIGCGSNAEYAVTLSVIQVLPKRTQGSSGFLIQSNHGAQGNFELVVPLATGGLALFFRDNDAPGLPWHGPFPFGQSAGQFAAVSLIESNFSAAGNGPGNLELVARTQDGRLLQFFRPDVGGPNNTPGPWQGPSDIAVGGTPVSGVSGI
jgi:hypothetical protein